MAHCCCSFHIPSIYSPLQWYTLKVRVRKHKMQTDCRIVNPGWEVEEGYEFFYIFHYWSVSGTLVLESSIKLGFLAGLLTTVGLLHPQCACLTALEGLVTSRASIRVPVICPTGEKGPVTRQLTMYSPSACRITFPQLIKFFQSSFMILSRQEIMECFVLSLESY